MKKIIKNIRALRLSQKLQITTLFLFITLLINISLVFALPIPSPRWGAPNDILISDSPVGNYDNKGNGVLTTDNNFIVIWEVTRKLQAQKISGIDGSAQWGASKTISSDILNTAHTVADSSGGAFIAWDSSGISNDIVQVTHVDTNGDVDTAWNTGGSGTYRPVEITATPANINDQPFLMADGSGGVYVLWRELSGDNNMQLTRVGSDGAVHPSWNTGGSGTFKPVQIPEPGGNFANHWIILPSDGTNVLVAYEDGGSTIAYAVKLDATGTVESAAPWSSSYRTINDAAGSFRDIDIDTDSNGGLVAGYTIDPGTGDELRAQRLNSAGSFVWGSPVIVDSIGGSVTTPQVVRVASDGNGGVILVYLHDQSGRDELYAHHVDSTGTLDPNFNPRVNVSDTTDGAYQRFPLSSIPFHRVVVSDGVGGAYVLLKEKNGALYLAKRVQRIKSDGTVEFPNSGLLLDQEEHSNDDQTDTLVMGEIGSALALTSGNTADIFDPNIYGQYIYSVFNPCAGLGSRQFCGTQIITASTLTFQDIPDTFNFGTITEGSAQDLFNNENLPGPNAPSTDDLLQIFDDRNSGGFTLTVDPDGTFIEETATHTIPLANLYTVTSLDETDLGNVSGITYGAGFAGDQTVSAPLYVDVDSANLTDTATYTGLAPGSQFGGSPLVLMDGTLSSASGRNGTMSVFTNFYLKIDPSQQEGSYSLKLTYTLADSTT